MFALVLPLVSRQSPDSEIYDGAPMFDVTPPTDAPVCRHGVSRRWCNRLAVEGGLPTVMCADVQMAEDMAEIRRRRTGAK